MYAPSLVSKPRDEMSRFLTGVSDLVKEECCMTILHGGMNLFRFIVYVQSIEESKLGKRGRDAKRGRTMIKVNLGLGRGLQIKIFLVVLRQTMREVVVLNFINLLSEIVMIKR